MPEVWFAASDATPLIPSILMPHLPQSRSVGIGTASWTSFARDETEGAKPSKPTYTKKNEARSFFSFQSSLTVTTTGTGTGAYFL